MSFTSLDRILAKIEQQPGWEEVRQYRHLVESWAQIVGEATAKHTRPLSIQKQILWVATSSSARAQELTFQRYSLLKKINSEPVFNLKNLRFSSLKWTEQSQKKLGLRQFLDFQNNKQEASKIDISNDRTAVEIPGDTLVEVEQSTPQAAVKNLIKSLEKKRQQLPVCPRCNVSTPKEELQRWHCCRHCIARQWSIES
jgi:predicted nucleic acid-binding Zn ribbon protein